MTCQGCDTPIPPSRGGQPRKWCSERCRKRTLYDGKCIECGGRTNGYDGPGTAATRCQSCIEWTDAAMIEAIRRWASSHGGIPPTVTEWRSADGRTHPAAGVVIRRLGWNEALLKAGFALMCDRREATQATVERMLRDGRSVAEIADRFGWTRRNVYMRLRTRGLHVGDFRVAA